MGLSGVSKQEVRQKVAGSPAAEPRLVKRPCEERRQGGFEAGLPAAEPQSMERHFEWSDVKVMEAGPPAARPQSMERHLVE